jgi:hypothetical protein
MIDKVKIRGEAVQEISSVASQFFHLDLSTNDSTQVLRRIMPPEQLLVYDFAFLCETEMLKCDKVGAFLPACIMGAAMVEALLSLICLQNEDEVKLTHHYGRAKHRETFAAMVGRWKFEHLIRIAAELDWIPNSVVSPDWVGVLQESYSELAPINHPGITDREVEEGAKQFEVTPGIALLCLIQDVRNAVHSGKWLRGRSKNGIGDYESWCRVAVHASAEVRDCLIHMIQNRGLKYLREALGDFTAKIEEMRGLVRSQGRDPAEVDRFVSTTVEQIVAERIGRGQTDPQKDPKS